MTEADYPYTGVNGACAYDASKGTIIVSGYTNVPANSTAQLVAAIAKNPVSVAIEADTSVFQLYNGGIISDPACGTELDHGVLVVGYGTENGTDYYILKNSWGPGWGENGFFRIAKTDDDGPGICGLKMQASYPTLYC
jgi:KDEL-tailed cysteine endopeptidase